MEGTSIKHIVSTGGRAVHGVRQTWNAEDVCLVNMTSNRLAAQRVSILPIWRVAGQASQTTLTILMRIVRVVTGGVMLLLHIQSVVRRRPRVGRHVHNLRLQGLMLPSEVL